MTGEVWIAELFDYDSYSRFGFFDSQYKAFIACLEDYKEYKGRNMPFIKKREFSSWKWHRSCIIKRLRNYQICLVEVK